MKVRLAIAMISLFTAMACDTSRPSGALTPNDIAAMRTIAEQDAAIVLNRDWDALAARFAPTAVRMPPNAPAQEGRDAIRAALEATPPMSAFDFRMVDLQGDGQLAYMRVAWSVTVTPPGGDAVSDAGKILIVFEKQPDGSWLTVADAWNSDVPLPN